MQQYPFFIYYYLSYLMDSGKDKEAPEMDLTIPRQQSLMFVPTDGQSESESEVDESLLRDDEDDDPLAMVVDDKKEDVQENDTDTD